MTEERIEKLEALGFKRWTKNGYDRLYINSTHLGLELDYYKTGNIHHAEFKGDRISNSQGYRYKAAKTFYDLKADKLVSEYEALREAAQELIDSTEEE